MHYDTRSVNRRIARSLNSNNADRTGFILMTHGEAAVEIYFKLKSYTEDYMISLCRNGICVEHILQMPVNTDASRCCRSTEIIKDTYH